MYYWYQEKLIKLTPATNKQIEGKFYQLLESAQESILYEYEMREARELLEIIKDHPLFPQLHSAFVATEKICIAKREKSPYTGPKNYVEAIAAKQK